jgi:hypothetical protein
MADIKINQQTGEIAVPQQDGQYRIYAKGQYKFNSQTNEYAIPTDTGEWEVHQGRAGPTKDAAASKAPNIQKAGFLPFSKDMDTGDVSFDPTAGILGSLVSGVTLPGDVASGKVDPESQAGMDRMLDFSMLMTPAGAAARAGETALPGALKALRPGKPEIPSAQALKEAAEGGYTAARDMGVDFSSSAVKSLADDITAQLESKGILDVLSPKTFSILRKLQEPPEDSVVNLTGLIAGRRALGNAAGDFTNNTERKAAGKAISALDRLLEDPDPASVVAGPAAAAGAAIKEANANYAAAMRSNKVTGKAEKAELDSAAANSGLNLDNRTRQILKGIIDPERPKNARGYSKEELALINDIVRGKHGVNAARWLGNFLGGGGGMAANLGGLGTAAIGLQVGGPFGLMAGAIPPLTGLASRKAAIALTQRQVKNLDELIRKRSPLYEKATKSPPVEEILNADVRSMIARALAASAAQQSGEPVIDIRRALGPPQ